MKMGNIVPIVGIKSTSLVFRPSVLTITPPRVPADTTLPTPTCIWLVWELSADYCIMWVAVLLFYKTYTSCKYVQRRTCCSCSPLLWTQLLNNPNENLLDGCYAAVLLWILILISSYIVHILYLLRSATFGVQTSFNHHIGLRALSHIHKHNANMDYTLVYSWLILKDFSLNQGHCLLLREVNMWSTLTSTHPLTPQLESAGSGHPHLVLISNHGNLPRFAPQCRQQGWRLFHQCTTLSLSTPYALPICLPRCLACTPHQF